MDDNLYSRIPDDNPLPYPLGPRRCDVCASSSRLSYCGGCKVVSYCGIEHQSAHRSKHKAACNRIKKSRKALEREEAALRARPGDMLMPENVFDTCVGHIWGLADTRDYMRARFAAADALLKVNTTAAVEKALNHFTDMLRLCRGDNMGVRNIIPSLLLRLGREQECYDFLKWWAIINDKDHYDGKYNWSDITLPYLDIHNADAFESIRIFNSRGSSLSHLAVLTLLKLRTWLDLSAYEAAGSDYGFGVTSSESDAGIDRPIGQLVRARMKTIQDISETTETLELQYRKLCRVVNDKNHHFWEALIDEGEDVPGPPPFYSPGSPEEAQLALHQCKRAWQESEDAIMMVESDATEFSNVYAGPAVAAADVNDAQSHSKGGRVQNMEMRRGIGDVFPSRFKPPQPTSSPVELFPSTPVGRHQTVRFVHRNDRSRVLVYVDGACSNNGQSEPRAGWAVVCGPSDPGEGSGPHVVSGRLEDTGPFGDSSTATSNRAELRAAIAALRLCDWRSAGFDSIVIATDSSYVVNGATGWVKGWVRNGWKTRTDGDVKNRDLWELLLGEVERWKGYGLLVALWKIPRELNRDADKAAKKAAGAGTEEANFADISIDPAQGTTVETDPHPPRILVLCLEEEALFDSVHARLISLITSKAKIERAITQEAALSKLGEETPPSVIIAADGAVARQRVVWERVIDRLREGATVLLAGCFSSFVNEGAFNRLFTKLGLPWKRGSYYRTTINLRRGVVGSDLASRLPSEYSAKSLYVRNVESSAVWYAPTEASGEAEAAVVFAKVGQGRLGYVGDVNGEEASDEVVLAMCGLAN